MDEPAVEASRGRERLGAFERAVGALAQRERTTAELSAWLLGRGFAPAEAEAAVARLIELGELDDERFAHRYAADKRELNGWGAERIREALSGRGLERELIDSVLAEGAGGELARATALLARRGPPPGDDGERSRALAYLARRGYDAEVAYEAVRRSARRAA